MARPVNAVLSTLAAILAAGCMASANPLPTPIAVYNASNGSSTALYTDKGPCEGDARLAIFTYPDQSQVRGCWVANPSKPVVHMAFLDGDSAVIPAGVFQPPKGA